MGNRFMCLINYQPCEDVAEESLVLGLEPCNCRACQEWAELYQQEEEKLEQDEDDEGR